MTGYLKKHRITLPHSGYRVFLFSCFLVFLFSCFLAPSVSAADAAAPNAFGLEYGTTSGLGTTDVRETVARIINVALSLLGIVALVIILYGGFVYMTAAGSEEKVAQARKIITNGVIGLAIILSAYAITRFIFNRLSEATDFQGNLAANCSDLGFADNNRELCRARGGDGDGDDDFTCRGNTGQAFVVRSLTPGGNIAINNFAVRAVFSQGLNAEVSAENVFTISRGGNNVNNEFNFSFLDAGRSVVEARLAADTDTAPTGFYEVQVSDVQSASGQELETETACGTFNRDSNFRVTSEGVVDSTNPNIGNLTYNGLNFGGAIALPRGRTHLVAVPITDDSGAGYVRFEVIPPQGNSLVIFDGPATERGSAAAIEDPYVFEYPLFIAGNAPTNQNYTLRITAWDIDHNSVQIESRFRIVGANCDFGDGGGEGEDCRQNTGCNEDADCLSGSCDTETGQCREVPLIADVSPWDGAGGNWVTILGNFFGQDAGTVEFGVNINDGDDANDVWVPANLAECSGGDTWTNRWIIAEVPRDDAALPNEGNYPIRVTRADNDPAAEVQLLDTTNNNRGSITGPRQGLFRKDNSIVRPGLCSVVVNEGDSADVATAGVPGIAVRATGQNFTDNAGQIIFGGVAGNVGSWSDTQIDSAVPQSLGPGQIGVVVRAGGIDSNGVPFLVFGEDENVRPIIELVEPTETTRGSFFTITGQRLGNQIGIVYLAPEGITTCTTETCILAELPQVCGSGGWQSSQIVVAVPTGTDLGTYRIVVQDFLGRQTVPSADTLTVINGGPRPGICSLSPSSGSAPLPATHEGLTFTGRNFSSNAELDPMTVFFFTRNSAFNTNGTPDLPTWLQTAPANITNVRAGEVFRARIPLRDFGADGSFSAFTGSVFVQRPSGLSNPVRYTVSQCNETGAEIPNGMRCCVDNGVGFLRPAGQTCPGETRTGGYLWRFTTGLVPNIPRVVVSCDQANWTDRGRVVPFPSPTPSVEWQQGENVCVNSSIAVRFSMDMDLPATPNNDNNGTAGFVRLYTCAEGERNQPDCSPNRRTDITGQIALQYANRVLRIRQVPPAANLNPTTWYHVEILNNLQSLQPALPGRSEPRRQPLLRNRPCGDDTAFCFDFKTGADNNICELSAAGIHPPAHVTNLLGTVYSPAFPPESEIPFYYYLWGRGNQVCSVLPVDGLGWDWSVTDGAASANVAIDAGDGFTDSRATTTALADNAPDGATIQAVNDTIDTTSQLTAESNLLIDLGEPRVKKFFPNCSEACINAAIGVEFTRQMDQSTYDDLNFGQNSGLVIFECNSEADCNADDVDRSLTNTVPVTVDNGPNGRSDRLRLYVTPNTPNQALEPNTWYWAEARDTIISIGRIDTDNNILAQGPPLEPFGWRFRTKEDGSFCVADNVKVKPDPFKALLIGQKTKYTVSARTNPDQCSSSGQELNPWHYGWQWETVNDAGVPEPVTNPPTAVAAVSNLASLGRARAQCTSTCLPAGSDVPSDGVNNALCGNDVVDPGEDCDISTGEESAGVSCNFSCLRPGTEAPICGNGTVDAGEQCDIGDIATQTGCSQSCVWAGTGRTFDASNPSVGFCGSDEVTAGEECEIGVGGETEATCSQSCLHKGTNLGQFWCDQNNDGTNDAFDRACLSAVSVCGNGAIESGEECEYVSDLDVFRLFDPTNIAGVEVNLPPEACSNTCQLQNVCDEDGNSRVTNSALTCNRESEGCAPDCTLAGSSATRYGTASICGDGQNADGTAGIGEFAWCELPRAGAVLLPNPVQVVTAVGTSNIVNPETNAQETNIRATLQSIRGEAGNLAAAAQVANTAEYALQCGYTEYSEPRVVNDVTTFNDCPNAELGVATNSCCYPRPNRAASYPADGQGLPGSTGDLSNRVCRNTAINVTFAGIIDEDTLQDKIVLARGYASAPQGDQPLLPLREFGLVGDAAGDAAGRVGTAFTLDGNGDEIVVQNNPNLNPDNITVMAWIRLPETLLRPMNEFPVIIAKKPTIPTTGLIDTAYMLRIINFGPSEGDPIFDWSVANVGVTGITTRVNTLLGDWVHVAGTFDGSSARLYINGNLEREQINLTVSLDASEGNLAIGNFLDSGSQFTHGFDGEIDEVMVYSRALTEAEIDQIVTAAEAGVCHPIVTRQNCINPPPGMVGWYDDDLDGPLPPELAGGSCGAGRIDVTDLVNDTISLTAANTSGSQTGSIWQRIWNTVRSWFAGLFGRDETHASAFRANGIRFWCVEQTDLQPTATHQIVTVGDDETIQTTARLKINSLLESDTTYALLMKGGLDGVKDTRGVSIASPDTGVNSRDDSILFRTQVGEEICRLQSLSVTPSEFLYTAPNTANDFAVEAVSTNGQQIVPIAGVYNWTWGWGPAGDPIFAIPANNTQTAQISSTALEGSRVAVASATITEDVGGPIGDIFSDSAQLRSLFCENPWPPRAQYPFEDGVPFGGGPLNNDGVDAQGRFPEPPNPPTSLPAANLAPRVPLGLEVTGIETTSNLGQYLVSDDRTDDVYIDRLYKFGDIPDILNDATFIRTLNSDKSSRGNQFLTFEVNQPVTIFVAHDNRIVEKPAWLRQFTDTEVELDIEIAGTFTLFRKDFSEGSISLGGNFGTSNDSMYIPFIIGQGPKVIDGVNSGFFNFEMSYCADAGSVNDKTDDLPYLRTFVFGNLVENGVAVSRGLTDTDTFKRYLFFNEKNDDAIGIQIFANPGRLSISEWYEAEFGSVSGFQRLRVGGYEALSDGNNVYINALNQSGPNFFNNVYQFSVNPDAQANTKDVFARLINSLRFNINLSDVGLCLAASLDPNTLPSDTGGLAVADPAISCRTDFDCLQGSGLPREGTNGVCSAAKTKFLRDWQRLHTIRDAQNIFLAGSAPALRSGTYIPGRSISRWPSWGTLGVGTDPINEWSRCGVCSELNNGAVEGCVEDSDCTVAGSTCRLVESQTCWDEQNSRFFCPRAQSVMAYEKTGTRPHEFLVHSPLEYLPESSNVVGEFVSTTLFTSDPICQANIPQSPFSQRCGDGLVNPTRPILDSDGNQLFPGEQCDPPGATDVRNSDRNNNLCTNGFATATCTDQCQWEVSQQCQTGGRCGNGRVEPPEICDDGAARNVDVNGYGSCNNLCTGPPAGYCGDGTVQIPQEVCEIRNNANGFCANTRGSNFDDFGQSWVAITNSGFGRDHLNSISVVDADTVIAVGANGRIQRTDDGGRNWSRLNLPAGVAPNTPLSSVHFVDENNGWVGGLDNIIIRTTDGGVNWQVINLNLNENYVIAHLQFVNQNVGWAAANRIVLGGGIALKSEDGGLNWIIQDTNNQGLNINGLYMINDQVGFVAGGSNPDRVGFISRTVDGGDNWFRDLRTDSAPLGEFDFINRNTGWNVSLDRTILKTEDGGVNWRVINSDYAPLVGNSLTIPDWRDVDFITDRVGFITDNQGGVWKSTDGGESVGNLVKQQTPPPSLLASKIKIFDTSAGWVVGSRGLLYKTGYVYCTANNQCNDGTGNDICLGLNSPDYAMEEPDSCALSCQQRGSFCGDGQVQAQFEQCDDGNRDNNDGCTNTCLRRAAPRRQTQLAAGSCGNFEVDAGEACDNGTQNGIACTPSYARSCSYCSRDCSEVLTVDARNFCGNGRVETIGEINEQTVAEQCEISAGRVLGANGIEITCVSGIGPLPSRAFSYRGEYTCGASCRALTNNCTVCGRRPLTGGGAMPRVALINPMIGNNDSQNWPVGGDSGQFRVGQIRLVNTDSNFSIGSVNNAPDNRKVGEIIADNGNNEVPINYREQNPVFNNPTLRAQEGVESRAICDGVYGMFLGIPYPGDRFPYQVDGEGAFVNNEYVISPAVPEETIRVVVRWTATESSEGSNVFVGNLARNATDRVFYADQIANPNSTPPRPENRCSDIARRTTDNYWMPTGCQSRGGEAGNAVFVHREGGLQNTFVQAFTIDTNVLVQGEPYGFFVSTVNSGQPVPIANFGNSELVVEVYEARATGQQPDSIFRPARVFRIDQSDSSSNPIARFWHVFNLRRVSSYQISPVQAIQTGWQDVIRDLSIAGGPVVEASIPPRACNINDFTPGPWSACSPNSSIQTRDYTLINDECNDPSAVTLERSRTCTPACRPNNPGGCNNATDCAAVNGVFNRGSCVPPNSVGSGGACDTPGACTNGTSCVNNRCAALRGG